MPMPTDASGRTTILVAQHSMTNIFKGVSREMHAAVLYNRDRRFAGMVLDCLRRETQLIIGDNEPYSSATRLTTQFRAMPRRGVRRMPRLKYVRTFCRTKPARRRGRSE
jgi:predicted N-formylglutamate amidohydrolase